MWDAQVWESMAFVMGADEDEDVSIVEVSKKRVSPLALLSGGGASATTNWLAVLQVPPSAVCPGPPVDQDAGTAPSPHPFSRGLRGLTVAWQLCAGSGSSACQPEHADNSRVERCAGGGCSDGRLAADSLASRPGEPGRPLALMPDLQVAVPCLSVAFQCGCGLVSFPAAKAGWVWVQL